MERQELASSIFCALVASSYMVETEEDLGLALAEAYRLADAFLEFNPSKAE